MKLSKQITLGYALMLLLMVLIGGFSIYSIYKLDESASNLEGRYKTLSNLASDSNRNAEFPEPRFGKEMIDQALNIIGDQVKYNYIIVFLALGVALIFGGIITVMFPRKITKPILRLLDATKSVEKGNYSYRIENPGGANEISELTESFNKMLETVEDSHDKNVKLLEETRGFNDLLRERVEEAKKAVREQQNELIKAERLAAIGEVATNVAHEIKNPLSGITVALEMMKDKTNDEDRKHDISQVMGEVNRLDRIIKDLLQLSRPRDLELSEVNPNEIVEKAVGVVSSKAEEKGIEIRKMLNCSEKFLLDYEKIQQVLINLLFNGIESIENGSGKLTVETESVENSLRIKVSDTGSGIVEEDMDRIFEPFHSTKKDGTGLGLSISKRIIDAHSGKIEVSSEKEAGSTFTLSIPHNPKPTKETHS